MAIYISGVRNLPEQVQKNKDDIEDLQTADTNLEAKIDQEIADRKALIEASGNKTIIENPTENVKVALTESESNRNFVVFIDGTPKLNIDETNIIANEDTAVNGDLVVYGNIDGNSTTISGNITAMGDLQVANITANGDITTASGNIETSLGHVKGLALVSTIINVPDGNHAIQVNCKDSSNNNHVLKFDADTLDLTIDGNPVGSQHLYRYDIFLIFTDVQQMGGSGSFTLLSSTKLNITASNVIDFLYTNYKDKQISCLVEFDGAYYSVVDVEGNTLADAYFNFNNGDNNTDAIDTINDFVCQETPIF